MSYGDLAKATNNPKASRAVGQIMGHNSVIIMTPCHRVILSSGAIGNYTGGNHIKKWLLEHEKMAKDKIY